MGATQATQMNSSMERGDHTSAHRKNDGQHGDHLSVNFFDLSQFGIARIAPFLVGHDRTHQHGKDQRKG